MVRYSFFKLGHILNICSIGHKVIIIHPHFIKNALWKMNASLSTLYGFTPMVALLHPLKMFDYIFFTQSWFGWIRYILWNSDNWLLSVYPYWIKCRFMLFSLFKFSFLCPISAQLFELKCVHRLGVGERCNK